MPDSSFCTYCCGANALMGLVVLFLVYNIWLNTRPAAVVAAVASGFQSGPILESQPGQGVITSGAGIRFESEPSGGYTHVSPLIVNRPNGFLGNPEPPSFYDIGDISATYDTVVAASNDRSGEDFVRGKSAFAASRAAGNGSWADQALLYR